MSDSDKNDPDPLPANLDVVVVDVQWQTQRDSNCPEDKDIRRWACRAVEAESTEPGNGAESENAIGSGELTVRVVDSDDMQAANYQWRNIDKSTNVLSFPSDFPPEIGLKHYGDMLICAEVLAAESAEQGKSVAAHWAHIVVHGTLHLLGYDHIDAAEAALMERREIEILATLGVDNPYLTVGDTEISLPEVNKS